MNTIYNDEILGDHQFIIKNHHEIIKIENQMKEKILKEMNHKGFFSMLSFLENCLTSKSINNNEFLFYYNELLNRALWQDPTNEQFITWSGYSKLNIHDIYKHSERQFIYFNHQFEGFTKNIHGKMVYLNIVGSNSLSFLKAYYELDETNPWFNYRLAHTNPKTFDWALIKFVLNRKEDFKIISFSIKELHFQLKDKNIWLKILPKNNESLRYKLNFWIELAAYTFSTKHQTYYLDCNSTFKIPHMIKKDYPHMNSIDKKYLMLGLKNHQIPIDVKTVRDLN
jgi:hypothetical protein